jgi:hypothetical protein
MLRAFIEMVLSIAGALQMVMMMQAWHQGLSAVMKLMHA